LTWVEVRALMTGTSDKAEAVTREMSRVIEVLTLTLLALGGAVAAGIVQLAGFAVVLGPNWARVSLVLEGIATLIGFAALWCSFYALRLTYLANGLLVQGQIPPREREAWDGHNRRRAKVNTVRFALLPAHIGTCLAGAICYAVALGIQVQHSPLG
jgi:hypothetical protein